jgi:glutathione S-transferase
MSLCLYTSWFSPFARKAALGLELKGLPYKAVDALRLDFRERLVALNPRAEVPVLTDGDLVVVNSSDILQYLDWRYPERPLYPEAIEDRVAVRALERLADHRFDPIIGDCSYWTWANRDDQPPAGLLAAGQADLEQTLDSLERALASRPKPWPFGEPGIVECAWFPNLIAARPLGFTIDGARYGAVLAWLRAMRADPVFANDARRTAALLKDLSDNDHELTRLFWSGDRLEWLMSRGFHRWLVAEIEAGRAAFPDYGADAKRAEPLVEGALG